MTQQFGYSRPTTIEDASQRLRAGGHAIGGGTDVLTQVHRGIRTTDELVDLRGLGLDEISVTAEGLVIGATASVAKLSRDPAVRDDYAALSQAAASVGAQQLREMGTVAGNLCQAVRCWYFRHPDLTCWLGGGDTCYAQIGDARKHGLETGDCISVAPSDIAAALLALDAEVTTNQRSFALGDLYRRPTEDDRSTLTLGSGELITSLRVPRAPQASAYARTGERAAWSFALAGVAAARFDDGLRVAAIGVANLPRLIDPDDPLAGLPGLDDTRWKRSLLTALVSDAIAACE
jgi:xanthine dehydrogenase YagS FAD-binding subunit